MQNTHYERLGGAEATRQLVDTFYDLMHLEDKYHDLHALHPTDLAQSREKLFMFLSGWLGGPQLFVEKFGHPRLRRRHMPFTIGINERDQWMNCMIEAMQACEVEAELFDELKVAFFKTADFMRNQAE